MKTKFAKEIEKAILTYYDDPTFIRHEIIGIVLKYLMRIEKLHKKHPKRDLYKIIMGVMNK